MGYEFYSYIINPILIMFRQSILHLDGLGDLWKLILEMLPLPSSCVATISSEDDGNRISCRMPINRKISPNLVNSPTSRSAVSDPTVYSK